MHGKHAENICAPEAIMTAPVKECMEPALTSQVTHIFPARPFHTAPEHPGSAIERLSDTVKFGTALCTVSKARLPQLSPGVRAAASCRFPVPAESRGESRHDTSLIN